VKEDNEHDKQIAEESMGSKHRCNHPHYSSYISAVGKRRHLLRHQRRQHKSPGRKSTFDKTAHMAQRNCNTWIGRLLSGFTYGD
jgi:hypothetical protein